MIRGMGRMQDGQIILRPDVFTEGAVQQKTLSKEEARQRQQRKLQARQIARANKPRRTRRIQIPNGAGTELKNLLTKFGLKPVAGCKCNQRMGIMNLKGTEWCTENIDVIVGWLKEEADRAKLPFIELGAKILIKKAIRNAKKKSTKASPSTPSN